MLGNKYIFHECIYANTESGNPFSRRAISPKWHVICKYIILLTTANLNSRLTTHFSEGFFPNPPYEEQLENHLILVIPSEFFVSKQRKTLKEQNKIW